MVIPAGLIFSNVIMIATVVAGLYFTREILVPIALAVLLTFILAPIVGFLQRLHFPKVLAVSSAVALASAIVLSLGTMVMTQVSQLANDLPKYQFTLREKAHNLRDYMGGTGMIKSASDVLKDLNKELNKDEKSAPGKTASADAAPPVKPVPVEIQQPEPAASETLVAIMRPLVSPLTTTGIVVIFVIFFLFQRQDLRNRFIRLTGTNDLELTTTALDDAGYRLTRLFASQLALNACFGAVLGMGLFLIGVPSAPLWGLLAMILRFVPYVGPALAAVLPLTLAAAVGSDWSMVLWTAALFAIVEPLTGQVLEPLVCGHSAGLSPVAVVTAAAFWTWLWGPLGLILSTPITVCLVVVARHVERLKFIDVLLGDEPALTPQQANYQRLLAGDAVEIVDHALQCLKEKTLIEYYDEVLLGALRLGERDAKRGRLENERLDNILQTVMEVVEELHEEQLKRSQAAAKKEGKKSGDNVVPLRDRNPGRSVLCVPGLGRLDSAAALVVAEALSLSGFEASASRQAFASSSDADAPEVICVCFLEEISEARIRFSKRKTARGSAGAAVLVAVLSDGASAKRDTRPVAGTDAEEAVIHSIQEAIAEISMLGKPDNEPLAAAEPSTP